MHNPERWLVVLGVLSVSLMSCEPVCTLVGCNGRSTVTVKPKSEGALVSGTYDLVVKDKGSVRCTAQHATPSSSDCNFNGGVWAAVSDDRIEITLEEHVGVVTPSYTVEVYRNSQLVADAVVAMQSVNTYPNGEECDKDSPCVHGAGTMLLPE